MKKKNIFISFTTIPSRIKNLKSMIDSLLNQNITKIKIIINVPKKYDRFNESKNDISNLPKFISNISKEDDRIILNFLDKDYGPITKLIGALQYINEIKIDKKNCYIITVDDDVYYPQNFVFILFSKMIDFENENKKELVSFGSMGMNIDINQNLFIPNKSDIIKSNILEGKGGIIYKYEYFNINFMNYVDECIKFNECKYSDDIIISNWLSHNNIKRFLIFDKSYNRNLILSEYSLSYGNDKYSLSKPIDLLDSSVERYDKCINRLNKMDQLYFLNDFVDSFKNKKMNYIKHHN